MGEGSGTERAHASGKLGLYRGVWIPIATVLETGHGNLGWTFWPTSRQGRQADSGRSAASWVWRIHFTQVQQMVSHCAGGKARAGEPSE